MKNMNLIHQLRLRRADAGVFFGDGFTLIELLVVVMIIGILSAVALPQYEMAVKKARLTEMRTMTKAVKDAQEVFYMATGDYTRDFYSLDVTPPDNLEINGSGNIVLPGGSQLLVLDPSSGSEKRVYALNTAQKLGFAWYMDRQPGARAGKAMCVSYNSESSRRLCESLGGTFAGTSCNSDGSAGCRVYMLP